MRKLILKMSISLDGFVGGSKGNLDWIFKSASDDAKAWTVDKIWQAGAHVMGRKTFNDMTAFWPTSSEVFAPPMNAIPKIVFSRKGFSLPPRSSLPPGAESWAEAQVITGDLAQGVGKLKAQEGKELIAHGGASFARNLIQTGLIDEFWFLAHPVAMGQGLSLFENLDAPLYLKLIETRTFSAGAVGQVFRPV